MTQETSLNTVIAPPIHNYADMRRKNGFDKPFGIMLWCLGNEMDGSWQLGHKTAEEYGRLAVETAKLMKLVDSKIELVACGSSSYETPTFGKWEYTVLSECYEHIDYISIHSYFGNAEDNTEKWQFAPPMLEDVYNFEDALAVRSVLITILNNADRVKITCLAQLVNVIAPIMTKTGGEAWAQTIYYPFLYTSLHARGTVLSAGCICDSYDSDGLKVPYVTSAAVLSEDEKTLIILAVNRSLEEETKLTVSDLGCRGLTLKEYIALENSDLKAENTEEHPDTVLPKQKKIDDNVMLAPHSWNLLAFQIDRLIE